MLDGSHMTTNDTTNAGGRLIVYTKAAPGRDDEFNHWYDDVHLPEVLALGPFTAAERFRVADAQAFDQPHDYVAIYSFEGEAADALAALLGAAGELTMSDAMQQPFMTVCTPITPR